MTGTLTATARVEQLIEHRPEEVEEQFRPQPEPDGQVGYRAVG